MRSRFTARIVAASDAGLSRGNAGAEALRGLRRCAKHRFDPQLVAALVAVIAQRQIAAA
jgi:hypothetical protein